jgi:CMP-2-keto-3-deoxyoctulosonic acid synthetase
MKRNILSPEVSKVVCDVNDNALYFSRAALPFTGGFLRVRKKSIINMLDSMPIPMLDLKNF